VSARVSRRALLAGAAGAALATHVHGGAWARGRINYGGRVVLHAPWPLVAVDPHRIDDVVAAFFGDAMFDALYARDETGAFVPSLAESDPQVDGTLLRVTMRAGVRFWGGAMVDVRVAVASLARARARDAGPWLAEVPSPKIDGTAMVFAMRDARKLVRALASPLCAILPPRYNPERPDATGPMRGELKDGTLTLTRNALAASGPSFLDSIEAGHAPDLATSLRNFEGGTDDVGWLGSFLHEPRAGAKEFNAGATGWAILRTGRDAGALDAPGTAQALADGVPPAALASLVVGAPWEQVPAQWSGQPCDLVVREDAPWLVEVARAVAVALSAPSHEVTARPIAPADFAARRASRGYTLMIDFAHPAGPGAFGAQVGLATADDAASAAALVTHPPRSDAAPRVATRTMRIGVVGEARLQGGRAPDLVLPLSRWGRGVDWGSAFRVRR
jgi:peptide/nickel transport system substrate-binding protein